MSIILRVFTRIASGCFVLAMAGSAYAQTADSSIVLNEAPTAMRLAPTAVPDRAARAPLSGRAFAQPFTVQRGQSRSRGMSAAAKGAFIGGGAAAAVTAVAASAYGQNEGGGFCGACFVRWSAFAVPVGAGLGALIGFGIDRAHRPLTAVPLVSRTGGGVVVTARF